MDWLTPESLGGAGVGLGTLLLTALLRLFRRVDKFMDVMESSAERRGELAKAVETHFDNEEGHQREVRMWLARLASVLERREGIPSTQIHHDTTPICYPVPSPPAFIRDKKG